MPTLTIRSNDELKTVYIPEGITLLEALHQHGHTLNSPCSGKGVCGKCRVQIISGAPAHSVEELKHLSYDEQVKGIHLSCLTKIVRDMEIKIPKEQRKASIVTSMHLKSIAGAPVVTKRALTLSPPTIDDQQCDDMRLLSHWHKAAAEDLATQHTQVLPVTLPLPILQKLPNILRNSGFHATVIDFLGTPIGVESGDTTERLYGVAVDIGTTTLAAYLYDLNHRTQLSVASLLNPQSKYGADVISRIEYSAKSSTQQTEIAQLIQDALNKLFNKLTKDAELTDNDIYLVTIAGNTTMLHLLAEIPALQLASAPFIPVTRSPLVVSADALNLSINRSARVVLLPSVSAYVGADTVTAVLSEQMQHNADITLMVDIGTNGEIVLGNRDALYACSTAAGPAFEGANIFCGMGGIDGAISEVIVDDSATLNIKTIGGHAPIGICGSGLIDAVAALLQIGIIDETGRIVDEDELPESACSYRDRLCDKNGQMAFLLVPAVNTGHGDDIVLTQKDIREVQNAKAAIAAGIQVLIREAGYSTHQIDSVYLAGGFGSYLRITSALKIGLLPQELFGKIHAVGNAAGSGAVAALLSRDELLETEKIAKKIHYLELSSHTDFVAQYTDNMFFE